MGLGQEDELLEALSRYRLDLVVAGITGASPWGAEVAFTSPYFHEVYEIGVPAGSGEVDSIEGVSIYVKRGSALGASP